MNTCETCKYWKPQEECVQPLGDGNAWCEMAQNAKLRDAGESGVEQH